MFKIIKKSKISKARLGAIKTAHGEIQTPCFMPDATRGVIKGLSNEDWHKLGLEAAVVNTYHLYLQPGVKLIKKAGGAHGFINWDKPLLSDSGGYQVYSLIHKNKNFGLPAGKAGKITDDKVIFRSPLDGAKHELTPERSIQIQFALGTDMIVCLDDCPPHNVSPAAMAKSVARTVAWAKRCKIEYEKQSKKYPERSGHRPLLFAVIQGGTDLVLRQQCAKALIEISTPSHKAGRQGGLKGFSGYGFGARPVDGEGRFIGKILQATAEMIPADSLRFGLGIGLPEDIVRCVTMGWDIFDCVIPTREGRHGRIFQEKNSKFSIGNFQFSMKEEFYTTININNARFAKDFRPINAASKLPELREYSRAYLHHLFKIGEPLGQRLASLNNLEFYFDLMRKIRENIKFNRI